MKKITRIFEIEKASGWQSKPYDKSYVFAYISPFE